ncbi:pre-mRNA-splicing factor cwc22, partial [Marasmius tenuissimus]
MGNLNPNPSLGGRQALAQGKRIQSLASPLSANPLPPHGKHPIYMLLRNLIRASVLIRWISLLGHLHVSSSPMCASSCTVTNGKANLEYQQLSWDTLRKSITGIVNRVNFTNVQQLIPKLFTENLIRSRGLFAWSIVKAQA